MKWQKQKVPDSSGILKVAVTAENNKFKFLI